jgi:hypothetical protein
MVLFDVLKHTVQKNNMGVLFCPMLPKIRMGTALFEGSQTSLTCTSQKSGMKIKIVMVHWGSDTDRDKKSTSATSSTRFLHKSCSYRAVDTLLSIIKTY